jgi:hypothetical protein
MNANPITYSLGPADDLAGERPTIADLQRAQVHALHEGDRRRAAAYALVVQQRIAKKHAAA